ncbi:hypothetical protein PtB15_2B618 [Puccinia triticina]|nr:hypothetical protein PtB15_2B618 [Puccinia triticina]
MPLTTVPPDTPKQDTASFTPKTEIFASSEQGLESPPVLPAGTLEVDRKAETPVAEPRLEIVALQDDVEGPIMTARSVLIGVLLSAFGVSVTQIASVVIGRGCALIPGPGWWNPGPFGLVKRFFTIAELLLKEAGFSALMGTTASGATLAAEMIVAYELYFGQVINFGVAFGILMSSQLLGFGWAGLLQPILVYPSRAVYPEALPSVSLLTSLFKVGSESEDQVKFFKKAFLAVSIYKILPTYVMPAFQAISIHQLIALVASTLAYFLAYSRSWFGAGVNQNFPFMSASLLTADGKPYPYRQAINADGTANEEFIQRTGLPFYTATFYLVQILLSACLTSSISHALLHNYHLIGSIFKKLKTSQEIDPHRLVCLKYKDFPRWGFAAIVLVAVALTFGMSSLSNSGISFAGLLVALVGSFLMTLGTGFIFATTGFIVRLLAGIQMFGGLLFPGNVFGSMWFTIYGASSAIQGLIMLINLKYGQYIHLPQNLVVRSQLIGCTIGSFATLAVVKSILKYEREVLLSPNGNGVFSGAEVAAFQARSVSWGVFSRRMFLFGQKYSAVSWASLVGLLLPIPFFIAHKFWPRYKLDLVNVPLLLGIPPALYTLAYAGEPMRIAIGITSQFWTCKYRNQWFVKYNYILSAALDGGTELVVFLLAMVFQGGGGKRINFPTYFLNPTPSTPRDYCFMNPETRGNGLYVYASVPVNYASCKLPNKLS